MTGRLIYVVYCFVAPLLVCSANGQGTLTSGTPQSSSPQSVDQIINRNQNPYSGSLPGPKSTTEPVELSLQGAIQNGLRYNLGAFLSRQSEQQARGARLQSLAGVLPNVNGSIGEQVQKINLQALGIGGVSTPGGIMIPKSVGPFSTNDATAAMTWNIFDLKSINSVRAANQNVRASDLSYRDARETVVIAVSANYLLTLAADSRVTSDRAQLETARSLFQLAQDQEKAGVGTYIDTLRSNVELQGRQQALTQAEDDSAKQRIALARTIGFPVKQQLHITDQVPYKPLPDLNEASAFQDALKNRPDYLSALAQLRSAELQKKAAWDEYLPSLGFNGNYGVIGRDPASVSPQWTAAGEIQIPIFRGGKVEGDVKEANSALAERRATVQNLRGQIEQDVENAFLDLQSAAKQVDTANAQLKLATETLSQAQDRFKAGVTNNIEVIQAQESLSAANDAYINSLYAYNVAKVLLARAVGSAEKSVLQYLQIPGNTSPASNPRP
jgi:outer membrane protein TolC